MQRLLRQSQTTETGSRFVSTQICTTLLLTMVLVSAGCSTTTPQRPAYSGPDNVGALNADAFIGKWKYSVLNPTVDEERNVSAIYQFAPDGTFTANAEVTTDFPMTMESTGTWTINEDLFVLSVADIKETSGNAIAAFAVNLTKGLMQKQSGAMNPYSISENQIVMVSPEHGTALQLDRL